LWPFMPSVIPRAPTEPQMAEVAWVGRGAGGLDDPSGGNDGDGDCSGVRGLTAQKGIP
jgi:hypothetical protein